MIKKILPLQRTAEIQFESQIAIGGGYTLPKDLANYDCAAYIRENIKPNSIDFTGYEFIAPQDMFGYHILPLYEASIKGTLKIDYSALDFSKYSFVSYDTDRTKFTPNLTAVIETALPETVSLKKIKSIFIEHHDPQLMKTVISQLKVALKPGEKVNFDGTIFKHIQDIEMLKDLVQIVKPGTFLFLPRSFHCRISREFVDLLKQIAPEHLFFFWPPTAASCA